MEALHSEDVNDFTQQMDGLVRRLQVDSLEPERSSDDSIDALTEALKRLPQLYREVLTRWMVVEESDEQISQAMNLSLRHVQLLKRTAITRAHELLENARAPRPSHTLSMASAILPVARELQKLQAPVFMRALEVFGVEERALSWMDKPNPALGNVSPLEALLYDNGRTDVMNLLGRIEHGVLS